MTDLDLTGRKALVTGGAQGLGEGMARALASAGATVVIADLPDVVATTMISASGDRCSTAPAASAAIASTVPYTVAAIPLVPPPSTRPTASVPLTDESMRTAPYGARLPG